VGLIVEGPTAESSKAIQEVAKASGVGIEAARELGKFLDKVFGDFASDVVGVFHDQLKVYRFRKAVELAEGVERKLKDRGVEHPKTARLKVALGILDAATLEDDQRLDEVWSSLLASAMDPNRPEPSLILIDAIKGLPQKSILLLDLFLNSTVGVSLDGGKVVLCWAAHVYSLSELVSLDYDEVDIDYLFHSKLIQDRNGNDFWLTGRHFHPSSDCQPFLPSLNISMELMLSKLGLELYKQLYPEVKPLVIFSKGLG